jgi:hypothetical protein
LLHPGAILRPALSQTVLVEHNPVLLEKGEVGLEGALDVHGQHLDVLGTHERHYYVVSPVIEVALLFGIDAQQAALSLYFEVLDGLHEMVVMQLGEARIDKGLDLSGRDIDLEQDPIQTLGLKRAG